MNSKSLEYRILQISEYEFIVQYREYQDFISSLFFENTWKTFSQFDEARSGMFNFSWRDEVYTTAQEAHKRVREEMERNKYPVLVANYKP